MKNYNETLSLNKNQNSKLYQSKVSVIITTYNRCEKVLRTIKSVLNSVNFDNIVEIIVIDDASDDNSFESITNTFSGNKVRVLRNTHNKMVSECRNIGLKEAKGEYVLFLDDDVIISPEATSALLKFLLQNKNVACALPMILYYDKPNIIWCVGVKHNFWTTLGGLIGRNKVDTGQFRSPINSDSVITAFMVRRSIAHELKFDSQTFPTGWEDMDFGTRIRRSGYNVVFLPWVKVWHDYSHAHFLKNKLRLYFEVRNRVIFHKRWSRNTFQYIISTTFSVTIGLSYIILSIFFSRDFFGNFRTVLKALADGVLFK